MKQGLPRHVHCSSTKFSPRVCLGMEEFVGLGFRGVRSLESGIRGSGFGRVSLCRRMVKGWKLGIEARARNAFDD